MKIVTRVFISLLLFFVVFSSMTFNGITDVYAYDNGKSLYSEDRYDYRTRRHIKVDFNGGTGTLFYAVQVDRTSKGNVKEGMWIDGLGIGTLVKDIKGEYHYLRSWPNNESPKEGTYWMEMDTIGVTPYLVFSHLKKTGYTYNGIESILSNGKQYLGISQSYKGNPARGIGAKASGWTMAMKSGNALKKWLKDNPDIYFSVLWKANTYTIQYNGNGADRGFTPHSYHTYDIEKKLSANNFYKDGFEFIGWATSEDGDVVYKDKEVVLNLTDQNEKTIILYAKWKPIEYTNTIHHIVYNSKNQYMLSLGTSTFEKYYNDNFTLNKSMAKNIPEGFYLSSSFKNVLDKTINTFPKDYRQTDKDMKFEFYYLPKKYNIHYELNGGINNPSNPSSYTILDGFSLVKPYKKGCEFLGWYIGNQKMTSINKTRITQINSVNELYLLCDERMYGDLKLTAKWKTVKPTIETKVSYYYKDDAISNKQVLKNASAYDEKDGDISSKVKIDYFEYSNGTIVKHPSYLDTSTIGCINVMYTVTNSYGQTTKELGRVFVIEKGSKEYEDIHVPKIYTRFIGLNECVDGTHPLDTLMNSSIWKYSDYHNTLLTSLHRHGNAYLQSYDYINDRTYINRLKSR